MYSQSTLFILTILEKKGACLTLGSNIPQRKEVNLSCAKTGEHQKA